MVVNYSKQARKFLNKQGKEIEIKIKNAIDKLPLGDVVKLQGYTGRYRLRVGDYRIIFIKEDNAISIHMIDNRGQVYKN